MEEILPDVEGQMADIPLVGGHAYSTVTEGLKKWCLKDNRCLEGEKYLKEREFVASEMKKTIEKRIPPALSPLTIKSKTVNGKRGDVPLIDTAQMIQSITHVEV